MSYHITNNNLRERYESLHESAAGPDREIALLECLIESCVNSEEEPAVRLQQVERGLTALMKLKSENLKHQVASGELLRVEAARKIASAYAGILVDLMRENLPDSYLHYIMDHFPIRCFDRCREDEELRKWLFPKGWQAAQESFTGENREKLEKKILNDRYHNERHERRLLENKK